MYAAPLTAAPLTTSRETHEREERMFCETVSLWVKGLATLTLGALTLGASSSLTLALFVSVAYMTTLLITSTDPLQVFRKSQIKHQ